MTSSAPQLRSIPDQIREVLLAHQEYLTDATGRQPADLTGGDLRGMDLSGYQLDSAILKNANFAGAILTSTTLSGADISGADFRDTSITSQQARSAKGWLLARWSPDVLKELGLPANHNDRVELKDFRRYSLPAANLSGLELNKAALDKANLTDANLNFARLTGASLIKAKLASANLDAARLAEANLDKADLTGANLEFASFEDASLRDAILTDTKGLNSYQLRGADLTMAKLPVEIADSLKTQPGVDEATKTSRKVFLTMLAACLYCWLTILSTTDARLLIGDSSLALPIVQTPIPVVAFFGAAPVLLLIIYLYLHFSLQNLWDALATLPAVFPDGRPVHERTLPWILSPIPRLHFKRLAPFCPRFAKFQVRAAALLLWWAVPVTLLAFFGRFLVRRDPVITLHLNPASPADTFGVPLITTLHVVALAVSVWLALKFWKITKDTLRGVAPRITKWRDVWLSRDTLAGLAVAALLAVFSAGCFYGDRPSAQYHWRWSTAVPQILSFFDWSPFPNFSEADLSPRPEGWDGRDLARVKGANLQERSLRNLFAARAFAVNANFAGADLRGATFDGADLRGAYFFQARLDGADFTRADLRFATFGGSSLPTQLTDANVQGTRFWVTSVTDVRNGNQFFAGLKLANNRLLAYFDLNFPGDPALRKDFSGVDLSRYRPFREPDFSGANLQHATLPNSLKGADLSKADLRNAVFRGTDLSQANLTGADIRGADLRNVRGLTRGQIESALIDGKTLASLPPYLKDQEPFTPKK